MKPSAENADPQEGGKRRIFFLLCAFGLAPAITIFSATPVAQAHGDLRTQSLYCLLITALLAAVYWVVMGKPSSAGSPLYRLVFLFPAYALWQLVPLPAAVLRLLSPSRAALTDALRPVGTAAAWEPVSVTPSATLFHFFLLTACALLLLLIFDLSSRFSSSPWVVAMPLIITAAGQAIVGLLQSSTGPAGIAMGTYAIRNHYSGLLEMVLPFALLYPFAVLSPPAAGMPGRVFPGFRASLGFVTAGLIGVAIVASLSRAGFFSALISTLFVAVVALCRGRSGRGIALVLAAGLLASVMAVFFLPSARLVVRFGEVEGRAEDRSPAWRDTANLIRAYPIVGCGLGAYESAFVRYKRSAPAFEQDYAHNDYLQYFAESGLIGFAVALLPLALLLARLWAGIRSANPDVRWLSLACAGSALAIAVHSFVDFNLYVPANMLVFAWILGMTGSVGQLAINHNQSRAGHDIIVLD